MIRIVQAIALQGCYLASQQRIRGTNFVQMGVRVAWEGSPISARVPSIFLQDASLSSTEIILLRRNLDDLLVPILPIF